MLPDELALLLDDPTVIVVDVRNSRLATHIRGSWHSPSKHFSAALVVDDLREFAPSATTIVFCAGQASDQSCAASVERELQNRIQAGSATDQERNCRVHVLVGGFDAWHALDLTSCTCTCSDAACSKTCTVLPAPVSVPAHALPTMEKCLTCLERNPDAKYRLVYFGWSGNRCGRSSDCGPRHPKPWPRMLADFEIYEVVLPGHGSRMNEPCAISVRALAREMAVSIRTLLMRDSDRPFCFVGFAFGAIIAHEVALEMSDYAEATKTVHHICTSEMRETLTKRPLLLVSVSSGGPSWAGRRESNVHQLDDAAFTEELRRRGGADPELWKMPELLDSFIPIIKADAALEETYSSTPGRLSPVPVLAIYGAKVGPVLGDPIITEAEAQLWRAATSNKITQAVALVDFDWFMLESSEGTTAVFAEMRKYMKKWVPQNL